LIALTTHHSPGFPWAESAMAWKKPFAAKPYGHFQAVLGNDRSSDLVRLWNPWGHEQTTASPHP
jgi:hypothetical protein